MKIIYKFMSILIIGFLLPIFILGYVAVVSMQRISEKAAQESIKSMTSAADERLREVVQDKAQGIDLFFKDYYEDIFLLKQYYEFINNNFQLFNVPELKGQHLYADKTLPGFPAYGYIHPSYGAYADYEQRGKGSPWIPKRIVDRLLADAKFRAEIATVLHKMMILNDIFDPMVRQHKNTLDLVWICMEVGLTNAIPPYDYNSILAKDPLIADVNENEKDYVRLLNPQNDPERKIRWLEPYHDPLKGIWMTSCVAPLYQDNTFLGTIGTDILLPTITKRILNIKVEKEGYAFLMASTGKIIAMPEKGITDMLWDEVHKKAIRETFLPPAKQKWTKEMIAALNTVTLSQSPDEHLQKIVMAMENHEIGVRRITMSGKDMYIAFAPIENANWSIGIVVPVEDVIAPLRIVTKTIGVGTSDIVRNFVVVALVLVAVILLVGMVLHYRIIKPLTQLTDRIAKVRWETMEFSGHGYQRKDEIGQLYAKFSEMLGKLKMARDEVAEKAGLLQSTNSELQAKSAALFAANQELEHAQEKLKRWGSELERKVVERTRELETTQEKLVRTEKLAALGKLAGSLSHELRNPLGVIANAVYYLTSPGIKVDELNGRESLYIIKRQVEMANRIIENALDFANPKPLEMEKGLINRTIDTVIADSVIPRGIKIEREYKSMREVLYDPFLIQQLFSNIIRNSIQAIKNEGTITISTIDEKEGVKVVVKDTGNGISKDDLTRVSEPLFSRKPRGIGLGLYIVKGIVERHKGIVRIESDEQKGTVVTVQLPYGNIV